MSQPDHAPCGVDATRPSPARLYDYYLGGTHHLPVDREVGEALKAAVPDLEDGVWANRGFHQRAATWLAAEAGLRQFIDIGSGLPTQTNTHEAVHKITPGARVVYVDNDPIVAKYASQLLAGDGSTAVITADLRDPESVLGNPGLRALIDFTEPVGLLMTAVLHFVADGSRPHALVRRYAEAFAPGSYLALSHFTADGMPPAFVRAGQDTYARATESIYPRSRADVLRFFDGLELVPPRAGEAAGLTYVGVWGAEDPETADTDGSRGLYCGVARVPAHD
jgi:S-adenosyl methyltransferase